jgi:tRNA/rRNA methyltransferase
MELSSIRVVLHRPSSAENVGAVARAMKNLGFGRLVIVAPASWSGPSRSGRSATAREDVLARARRLARKASDLLVSAEIHADARSALAEATWVCGTTSRAVEGRPRLSPRELAQEVVRRTARGPVAILFGEERRGLSNQELDLCQALCTIPTSPSYDSMNLAQAVAIVCYEISSGLGEHSLVGELPGEPARHATLEALWERLGELLAQTGYLNPQNPQLILAEWKRLLARAEPTQREVELLVAAVRAVQREIASRAGSTDPPTSSRCQPR